MILETMGAGMTDDWGRLLAAAEAAPDAPVTFVAGGRVVPSGQHVTEARLARIEAIDCGGRTSAWDEVQLQVLDGAGGPPMPGHALAGLMRRSGEVLSPPPGARLRVEAETGAGLGRFSLGDLRRGEDGTTVRLDALGAVCAPAADLDCCQPRAARCCG